jgi:hypothetical protein
VSYHEIRGDDGELVARLFALLEADSAVWPARWYDLTTLVSLWLGGPLPEPDAGPDEGDRNAFMSAVRSRVDEFLAVGVAEEFLVRSVVRELDRFMERQADLAASKDEAEKFREAMLRAIDDPAYRERHRSRLEEIDPEHWSPMSDEEFVQDLMRTAEEHPLVQEPSAEEATRRWARRDEWQNEKELILGDGIISRWTDKSIARRWQ